MIEKEPWEEAERPVSSLTAEGETPEKHRHSPELDELGADRGSIAGGIVGALVGALVGAVPWFLASTFSGWFIGWLGFLIGWASVYGYRRLRGRKSTAFATVTVLVCSIFALIAAEFCSWMYVLCTDPDWQWEAAYFGESVVGYVFTSLILPENLAIVLENVWVGLIIGILGVISARSKIVEYTDPEKAKAAAANPMGATPAAKAAAANMETGFALPRQFTVRDKKWVRALARIAAVFFALIGLLLTFMEAVEPEASAGETATWIFMGVLMLALAVFLWFHVRRRIEVDGDTLSYLPTFGRARTFDVSDIAGMKLRANGRGLCAADGKALARFEDNMDNSALLLQYLQEKGIGLMA